MLLNYVMNNYSDYLSIIENHLDSLNHEYQSHDNQIEIYSIDEDTIIINIKNNQLIISTNKKQYKFVDTDKSFFKKLNSLLSNF